MLAGSSNGHSFGWCFRLCTRQVADALGWSGASKHAMEALGIHTGEASWQWSCHADVIRQACSPCSASNVCNTQSMITFASNGKTKGHHDLCPQSTAQLPGLVAHLLHRIHCSAAGACQRARWCPGTRVHTLLLLLLRLLQQLLQEGVLCSTEAGRAPNMTAG